MGMRGVGLVMALLALSGCGDDTADAVVPTGGAGLGAAGAGAGGMATTAGAGAGGSTAGAGSQAGAGGGMAGGAAPMPTWATKPGCSAAMSMPPAMLHMTMVTTFTQTMGAAASCAASTSCHQMDRPKAKLPLGGATDMKALLVGKMACEAPMVPLADGQGGDAALHNSWLWIKMTAKLDGSGNIPLNAAWGTPGTDCGIMPPGSHGLRMPYGFDPSEEQLAAVRNWICAGAPGP